MSIKNCDFVHLHSHGEFSRFDGLSKTTDMAYQAREMGFSALALTDHGTVGGWIKFYKECRKKKRFVVLDGKKQEVDITLPALKPIFGQECYIARHHDKIGVEGQPDGRKGNRHLVLLAKNMTGYQNLCTLSQRGYTDGFYSSPRIDLRMLAEHSDGLICGSACLSSVVNVNLLHGRYDVAKKVATTLKDIFKEDFYLEVMYHGIDAEGAIIPEIIKLGAELDIPVCASNDCHYLKKEHASSQELLMAMSSSKCLQDPKHIHFPYGEFYMKSAEEMFKIFGSHPEVLYNTRAIAERVEDFLKTGGMRLPVFDVESARKEAEIITLVNEDGKKYFDGITVKDVLKVDSNDDKFERSYAFMTELVGKGMIRLGWHKSQPHVDRIKMELADIRIAWTSNKMDFATYFLIVWEYVDWAKRNGIFRGAGRGSGYASLVLRCLGITYGPCPLKYGLYWERFLGFSESVSVSDSDWGIQSDTFVEKDSTTSVEIETETDDLFEDRELENDLGGIDRY